MNPFTIVPSAIALAYAAVLICGYIEDRINYYAAVAGHQRSKYDPVRLPGKRWHTEEE